eukprot:6192430-Pleurochrysis_carterae.AAC.1
MPLAGVETSSACGPVLRVLRCEVPSCGLVWVNVVVTSLAERMRLCCDPLEQAAESASVRRERKVERVIGVSKRPQLDSVPSTRVIAGELQTGRQTKDSAQSGSIALPGTDKSHGRKPNAVNMGLSRGKESA